MRNKQVDGFRFRNQHPVYRYILDFYCPACKLAIEIDGDIHKTRKDYDEYRDKYLASIDITTLRFSNDEITDDISTVLHIIKENLNRLSHKI